MTNHEKTQFRQQDALRRVDALACLHPTTKESVVSWLRSQASVEEIADWRDKNLAFLERWIAPVSAPHFLKLCQRLSHLKDWETLRHALRLPNDATLGDWLAHASFLKWFPCECLWCLAQQLGLGIVLDTAQETLVRILFSNSVVFLNYSKEAATVLEEILPFTEQDYADAASLSRHLQSFVSERQLTGNNAANYMRTLADTLRIVGRQGHAVMILEAFVPLEGRDYADAGTLRRCLQRFASEHALAGRNAVLYVRTLADAFLFVGRPSQAALVLESFVPLEEKDYADAGTLRRCLQRFATQYALEGNSATIYVDALAAALGNAGRWRQASLALEAFVPLEENDYVDAVTLGRRLQHFASEYELEDNIAATYIQRLATALSSVGRPQQAILALEAFTRGFAFLGAADSALTASNGANLVSARLRCGFADADEGARLLERFIAWLRSGLRNTPAADKAQLMENISEMRRQVIVFADAQAQRAGSSVESERWRKRGLLWDAWLGQRVLLERMLLGRLVPTRLDASPTLMATGWPYEKRTRRPSWIGHRPSRGTWKKVSSAHVLLDVVAASAPLVEEVGEGERSPGQFAHATMPDPWQLLARDRLNSPFEERDLAANLGQKTLLLRAGFGPDGGLHWSAWQAENEVMRLVAHEARLGQSSDQSRLAWAQSRHDLRIVLAYMASEPREKIAMILDDIAFHRIGSDSLDDHLETFRQALLTVSSLDDLMARRILRIVKQAFQFSRAPEIGDMLAKEWTQLVKATRRLSLGVMNDLNAATADLITETGRIWDLAPLKGWLNEELDVVLVADDVLHGLPFAHLCVGERALFSQVRSTRASFSLVLDAIQKDIENAAPAEVTRRLSGAAWVPSGDAARRGGVKFLHGLSNLARDFGHGLSLAADRPAADLAWLRRQPFQDGPARVFGWYGHGHEEQAGIVVGPGRPGTVCKGEGMRLELFELMLVIACSLGRHRQRGTLDAESFCCDLTLNGMRSAVAARWPVHAGQAADVGNEIARQYLLLREKLQAGGTELTRTRIRSKALNQARSELLKDGSDYLNTLAAFELWGLA